MKTEKKYILSLDLGTQGTKAALLDLDGNVITCGFSENLFSENDGGEITLSAEKLLAGVLASTKAVLEGRPDAAAGIAAVGVVGMMAGIVGIGDGWEALTPYDSGLDKRCETAIRRMQQMGENKVIELCGSPIIVAQGAKMYWWKMNHPEVFARVKKFVPASTYVCGCMAGLKAEDAYIDYTHIHLTCFADVEHNVWSGELLKLFDFPEEKLPKIVAPYDVIGCVTREWADSSGLREGTPIVAGCGDTAASSLGAGLVRKNMVLDVAGTASVLTACVSEYRPDTEKKILICPRSIIPGLWTPFGFVLGGETMSWYFDQINYDGSYSFGELARAAAGVENEGLFFLPYFAGRICPSEAGFSGHWIGLKFYHGREHMFKSIMESIAYEYKFYLQRIHELFPELEIREVLTGAGGARSQEFTQVKADVLGMPFVPLKQKDTSHKAAAIIAGYGVGIYSDMSEMALKMSKKYYGDRVFPEGQRTERYSGQYGKYLDIVGYMSELHRKFVL